MFKVSTATLSRCIYATLLFISAMHITLANAAESVTDGELVQDMKRAALARLKSTTLEAVETTKTVRTTATDNPAPKVPLRNTTVSSNQIQQIRPVAMNAAPAPAVASAVVVDIPAVAVEPITPQHWRLTRGLPVHQQLIAWGEKSGWTVRWQPTVSWLVAADANFEGDFSSAISKVVDSLFFEGKPVRLVLWESNQVAEVISSDVR